MAIRITDDVMALEIDTPIVATRCSEYAAADGNSTWIVSACPARLLDRN